MFGYSSESDKLVAAITKARRKMDKSTIKQLLEEARKHRPGFASGMTFDEFVEVTRANYMGHQSDRLRRVLKKRYKVAGPKMPLVPINVTTETAELLAQAYRMEPERRLEVDSVDPLRPGQRSNGSARERAELFSKLVKEHSTLDTNMQEVDRITQLVYSCFGKIRWSSVESAFGRREMSEMSIFWPSQVFVIPDPSAPGKLFASRVVMLRLADVGEKPQWEIWARDQNIDGGGQPGWWYGRFLEDGTTILAMTQYELPDLPIVCFKARPSPHIIPDGDRDLVHLQDEINVRSSDHAYKAAFDSHQQVVINSSHAKPGQERAIGPGVVLELRDGESATTLPSDLSNLPLDAIQQLQLFYARSKRMPVDAFWTKDGNPETGVAREIRNIAADQKRAEHLSQLKHDEAEMLRLMARIADKWAGWPRDIDGDDVRYVTRFRPPKRFEDMAQKQQRLKADRDDGIISDARYAVEMGHFETIEEAVASGLSDMPKSKPAPQPFGAQNEQEPSSAEDEEQQASEGVRSGRMD